MSNFERGTVGTAHPRTENEQLVVVVSGDTLNAIADNPYVLTMDIVASEGAVEPYMLRYTDDLYIETSTLTRTRKADIDLSDSRTSFELQETVTRALTGICTF